MFPLCNASFSESEGTGSTYGTKGCPPLGHPARGGDTGRCHAKMSQPGPAPCSEQQVVGSGAWPGPCSHLRLPPGNRLVVADKGGLRVSGVTATAGAKGEKLPPLAAAVAGLSLRPCCRSGKPWKHSEHRLVPGKPRSSDSHPNSAE